MPITIPSIQTYPALFNQGSPSVRPSSSPLAVAARTALSTMASKPEASKLLMAASVVPFGLVTFLRSSVGVSVPWARIRPAPRHVCEASRTAWASSRPSLVAAATRCSTRAKK